MNIDELVRDISQLPSDWHGAGSVSSRVLEAIARHVAGLGGALQRSMESGSGKTTLLFSHLSPEHTVFAVDAGNSISQVKKSELLNRDSVSFVEGPTQVTMPQYDFSKKIQLALIDGPHGYPFPDLEYYYFYQIIEEGGLLLLDDTRIPSIGRMFEVISADDMFELLEVVDDTAFFRRTEAPLLNPLSDSWWLQGYNRPYYDQLMAGNVPPLQSSSQEENSRSLLACLGNCLHQFFHRDS